MYVDLLAASITAANGAPTAVKPTGSITTVAKASLISGEKVGMDDGFGTYREFVFDVTGSAVTLTTNQIRVDLSAISTADQVRDALITAINIDSILITASSGGAATVTLTHDRAGTSGNKTVTENVVNAGFIVAGMTGGSLSGVALRGPLAGGLENRSFMETDAGVISCYSTAGSAVMTVTAQIWGYQADAQRWLFWKALNGAAAMPEVAADLIRHSEVLTGMRNFSRIYPEALVFAGTGTAVNFGLFSDLTPAP